MQLTFAELTEKYLECEKEIKTGDCKRPFKMHMGVKMDHKPTESKLSCMGGIAASKATSRKRLGLTYRKPEEVTSPEQDMEDVYGPEQKDAEVETNGFVGRKEI
jgi:hypothetical protein